jgi:cytochrome c oxidase assembly protein subunit 15
MINASNTFAAPQHRSVALWLLICCGLLVAIVIVGGITRLTHSGLSIVEWRPIVGTLPPLNEQEWLATFELYQQTPEFRIMNSDMTLAGFKRIFWWEYVHRLLGRVIGVAFLLPLIYFISRKYVDRALGWRLAGIFGLGALQGAMGWYMVQSGLVDNPRVSPLRLSAHLGIACLIYAAMLTQALALLAPRSREGNAVRSQLWRQSVAVTVLILAMVLSGALVAGARAGRVYNTFPLMGDHFVPTEIFAMDPWFHNFFSNLATIQFDHRLLAWLLAFLVPLFWWKSRQAKLPRAARLACNLLLPALALQIALGAATLLMHVPIALAVAHQGGALLLFTAALAANYFLGATATAHDRHSQG